MRPLVLLLTLLGTSSATCRDVLRNDLEPPVAGCEPYTTRCNGHIAEVCSGQRRWREHTNCDIVTPGAWACGANEAGDSVCMEVRDGGR